MSQSHSGNPQPTDASPDGAPADDGGWGDFSSDHTTVDPTLLARLRALDDEDAAPEPGGAPAPNAAPEPTMTLDVAQLLDVEDPSRELGAAPAHVPLPNPAPIPAPAPYGGGFGAQPGANHGDTLEMDKGAGNANLNPVAEKTQVFMPAVEDEPTRAKLHILQGGGQQKEYMIARDRVTLGRGTNNDILIPDIAISRQHMEIVRKNEGAFQLRDLNSGNGTKLNGSRILEADLRGGDRIEIGSTIFEFILTGPGVNAPQGDRQIKLHPSEQGGGGGRVAPQASSGNYAAYNGGAGATNVGIPNYASGGGNTTVTHQAAVHGAPPASRSNLLLTVLIGGFGLLFLFLTAIVGYKVYTDQNKTGGATALAKTSADYYFEGLSHSKAREWGLAEEMFTFAITLAKDERAFKIRKDAKLQLERVEREKKNEQALKRGTDYANDQKYLDAIAKLETIRSGSVYYQDARKVIERAQENYADNLIEQARSDFDSKRYDDADRKLSLALATRPGHKAAESLRAEILSLSTDDVTDTPPDTKRDTTPKPTRTVIAKRDPNKKANPGGGGGAAKANPDKTAPNETPGGAKTGGGGGGSKAAGIALYRNKRFADAISHFNNIASREEGADGKKAATLARTIASFEQNYNSGMSAYQAKNWPQASRALTIAVRMDGAISGGAFRGALSDALAESNYNLAKSAFDSSNFSRAGVYAKKAKSFKPGHAPTLRLLQEIELKAKTMYIDAINKKNSDPKQARRIANNIISMLPSSSDTYKKARKLIKEL